MSGAKLPWSGLVVPSFEAVNNKRGSVEKVEGWCLGVVKENDRQNWVQTANRLLKEGLQDKYGQFSTEPPIENWLEVEGTVDGRSAGKVLFRQYLYFGDQVYLFVATAGSPERVDFLVKSFGTFSEESVSKENDDELKTYDDEKLRKWNDSKGKFIAEATLKEVTPRGVTLLTKSGKEIKLSFDKLSTDDQKFSMNAFGERIGR